MTREEIMRVVRAAGYNVQIRDEVRGKQRRVYTRVYVWPKGAIEERRSLGPLEKVATWDEGALRTALPALFADLVV